MSVRVLRADCCSHLDLICGTMRPIYAQSTREAVHEAVREAFRAGVQGTVEPQSQTRLRLPWLLLDDLDPAVLRAALFRVI